MVEIVNNKSRPKSRVTRNKEPNIELLAKALIGLYYDVKVEGECIGRKK
jgi:hypothetical protein